MLFITDMPPKKSKKVLTSTQLTCKAAGYMLAAANAAKRENAKAKPKAKAKAKAKARAKPKAKARAKPKKKK